MPGLDAQCSASLLGPNCVMVKDVKVEPTAAMSDVRHDTKQDIHIFTIETEQVKSTCEIVNSLTLVNYLFSCYI